MQNSNPVQHPQQFKQTRMKNHHPRHHHEHHHHHPNKNCLFLKSIQNSNPKRKTTFPTPKMGKATKGSNPISYLAPEARSDKEHSSGHRGRSAKKGRTWSRDFLRPPNIDDSYGYRGGNLYSAYDFYWFLKFQKMLLYRRYMVKKLCVWMVLYSCYVLKSCFSIEPSLQYDWCALPGWLIFCSAPGFKNVPPWESNIAMGISSVLIGG